jgi:hypothetical protein
MNTVIDFKSVEQMNLQNKECIKLNFGSILNQKDAISVCNEWKDISQTDKTKKYVIIFNAKDMIDYEPMTRTSFQNTMKELKDQIDQVWVISESKLIRGGAAIMGMLTSLSIKAVNTEDQIIF